jgi:hypothetical protein
MGVSGSESESTQQPRLKVKLAPLVDAEPDTNPTPETASSISPFSSSCCASRVGLPLDSRFRGNDVGGAKLAGIGDYSENPLRWRGIGSPSCHASSAGMEHSIETQINDSLTCGVIWSLTCSRHCRPERVLDQ